MNEFPTILNQFISYTGSRRSPSPYATTHIGEHIYAKPESRVSYYAASNLTHVSQVITFLHIYANKNYRVINISSSSIYIIYLV